MPENSTPTRDAKLVQYLNEAYALERRLETALQAHIGLAERDAYKKRLQEHLKETKQQAKNLERRIKALGGKATPVDLPGPDVASQAAGVAAAAAQKGLALAKGPAHALRGMSSEETQLKNAKTEFSDEHEEIATYDGIEALATALGDKETARLAREHRRQEQRMAAFLSKQIAQLAKAVATKEVPAAERRAATNGGARRSRRTTRSRSASATASRSSSSRSTAKRASSARGAAGKSTASRGTAKSTASRATAGKSRGTAKSASSRSRKS